MNQNMIEMKERIKSLLEYEKMENYWESKKQPFWHPGSNPTVDMLIVKDSKEILLIQRSMNSPAEAGKWALPGGFWDTNAKKGEPWKPGKETAQEAAFRELKEETGLSKHDVGSVPVEVGTYEGNGRDPRDNKEAWTKSTLFAVNLKDITKEPKGMDDARDAKWFTIEEVLKMKLAFDHSVLIADGLKKLGIL